MVLWFGALAMAGTFLVFQDSALDYRLVALGALVPDLFDAIVARGVGPFHSIVVAVGVLMGVMVATVGRRSVRRRALAIPIGIFGHLVLDAAFARTNVFWWPFAGRVAHGPVPSFGRPVALVVGQEVVGLAVGAWLWNRFGLRDQARRTKFAKTGRLDRKVM